MTEQQEKQTRRAQHRVILPDWLYEYCKEIADRQHVTISDVVRRAVFKLAMSDKKARVVVNNQPEIHVVD